jgi:beta-galactosidase
VKNRIAFILALVFILFHQAFAILPGGDISYQYRKIIDFNEDWLFEQDDWVGLHNASQYDWDDSQWLQVHLPHSWNMDDTFDQERGYYRGFGWYRKHFRIDPQHKDRRIYLNFGAIYNQAEIWINEVHFGPFISGYTPIQIDITDVVKWDEENLIAIRANNIHNDEIPPGRWRMDYNCYGGIYREVSLISLNPLHLVEEELFVTTPIVDKRQSQIAIKVKVKNQSSNTVHAKVVCQIFDTQKLIAQFDQSMPIPPDLSLAFQDLETYVENINQWSPDDPYLYTLKVILYENNLIVDDLNVEVGFRTFEFHAQKGFILNGQSTKLRGLNRHQCYPGLANAVPPRLQIEDVKILKELGANFVRCSHYPQHPQFLKACDSLGLLVYEEIASWQHIGGDVFIEHADRMLADMIRRDRNHPSVILWGLMNEGRSVKMFEKLHATVNSLDPTRPTCYAENHLDVAVELGTAFIPDVLGLNYKLKQYDQLHEEYPHLKLINSECSNPDNSDLGDVQKEITGALKIKRDLDFIESRTYLAGSCIWSMHDYGTEYEPVWPIQTSGVVDIYRRFKEAAYFLQSRWSTEPVIHIAGQWTWPGEEGNEKDVYIWNNCDKVNLFLNDKEIEISMANPIQLKLAYQPGELKATGSKGMQQVEHVLNTAGTANGIILSSKSNQLKSDGDDVVAIEAKIVDGNMNPCNRSGSPDRHRRKDELQHCQRIGHDSRSISRQTGQYNY